MNASERRLLQRLEGLRDLSSGVVRAVNGRLTIRLSRDSGLSVGGEELGVRAGENIAVDGPTVNMRPRVRPVTAEDVVARPGDLVQVDTSGGAVDVMLPPLRDVSPGALLMVKIVAGGIAACTITPEGGDLIDGAAVHGFSALYASRSVVASPRTQQWLIV